MENNDIIEKSYEVMESELVIEDPRKVLDALDRAKSDAKRNREEKEEFKKNYEKAMEQLSDWEKRLTAEKAERQMSLSGLPNSDKLKKYIDFDRISFNVETLEVEGVEEQIDEIKNEYPELFDPKIVYGGKADSGISSPVKVNNSVSELQARLLLGK